MVVEDKNLVLRDFMFFCCVWFDVDISNDVAIKPTGFLCTCKIWGKKVFVAKTVYLAYLKYNTFKQPAVFHFQHLLHKCGIRASGESS